jgi:hypothetical protein
MLHVLKDMANRTLRTIALSSRNQCVQKMPRNFRVFSQDFQLVILKNTAFLCFGISFKIRGKGSFWLAAAFYPSDQSNARERIY